MSTFVKSHKAEDQAKAGGQPTLAAPKKKVEKNPKKGERKAGPSNPKPRMDPRKVEAQNFTHLNTRVREEFIEIRRDPTFRWLAKMKVEPYKRYHNKFYEYHGDHGHLTKDCMVLR